MEISVQRALSELKGLEDRIYKVILSKSFIGRKKKSADSVYNTSLNVENFNTEVNSNYQSVTDLIARRNKIKSAVVLSNATTKISVAGVEMTVAEAIERKESIKYEKRLLKELEKQYNENLNKIESLNLEVEMDIKNNISLLINKDKINDMSKEIEIITKTTKEQREWEMIDPLNLKEIINDLEEKIQSFEEEVDFVLATSNVKTTINIE